MGNKITGGQNCFLVIYILGSAKTNTKFPDSLLGIACYNVLNKNVSKGKEMGAFYYINWDNVRQNAIISTREHRKFHGKENRRDDTKFVTETEVERIIEYVKRTGSNLSWFNGKVSEELLTEMIVHWVVTPYESKFLSQLFYQGIRYDYEPLIVPFSSVEKEMQSEEIQKQVKKFREKVQIAEPYFDVGTKLSLIMQKIQEYEGLDFNFIDEIIQINDEDIVLSLIKEKQLATIHGLEMIHSKRIAQYIKIPEIIVSEVLYSIIMKHRSIEQITTLKCILQCMSDVKKSLMQETSHILNSVKYQELKINEDGKSSSAITQFFVILMQYRAYAEEVKKIDVILEEDIRYKENNFVRPGAFQHLFVDDYLSKWQLIRDLKEKESRGEYDLQRLEEAKRFIALCNEKNWQLGDANNLVLLRIVYREIFMNKARLPDYNRNNTSMTIARRMLGDEQVENREELFLEKKIQRGFFRETGLLQEYVLFNSILREYREMLLQVVSLPNDLLMYQGLKTILDEVLRIIKVLYEAGK